MFILILSSCFQYWLKHALLALYRRSVYGSLSSIGCVLLVRKQHFSYLYTPVVIIFGKTIKGWNSRDHFRKSHSPLIYKEPHKSLCAFYDSKIAITMALALIRCLFRYRSMLRSRYFKWTLVGVRAANCTIGSLLFSTIGLIIGNIW